MCELNQYTDEQLKEELKRRAMERKKNAVRNIQYIEFEATVSEVKNLRCEIGKVKYIPFQLWKYRLTDCTLDIANNDPSQEYYMRDRAFKRDEAPKVGDRVKLKYIQAKKAHPLIALKKARIIQKL